MKVKIKKWSAVATWRWDIPEDDVCGICQIHFDGSCPSCRFPGDDCELLSGKCGHNFHKHCITQWIRQESARGQCPMCRQSMSPPALGLGQGVAIQMPFPRPADPRLRI
ncbi:RING finger domain-containing protein [Diaporthe helianthi]|uniref:Anaphase-promoting complex subunit 11 n=1 Tax=Diaporthe helianthi TaxID=158607 RepID=A0A2P5HJX4_DIAHE|nr:RING finger domain-containing protein [Diaporthe helianthi]